MKEKKHSVDWDLVKEETISWVNHIRSSENSRYKETRQANWMADKSFERMEPYLRDPDSPLSWLVENVPQELLPEVIAYWITTKFADRELISQLKHNGMGYDYTPLIAPLSSADMKKQDIIVQKKINVFNEAIGSLEQTFNPINEMIALIDGFEKHRNLSFEALISELQSMNKRVAFRLDVEKEMSFAFQLEGIKSIRAEQYAKFAEILISYMLKTLIFKRKDEKIYDDLDKIYEELLNLREKIFIAVNYACRNMPYQELIVNKEGEKTTAAPEFFVIYKRYKAYVQEKFRIIKILEQDTADNRNEFLNVSGFKYQFSSDYKSHRELIADLEEGSSYGTGKINALYKSQEFMVLCNEKGFFLGDPNDMVCLRRVYRELFKNKAKLTGGRENPKGINASTIVKHIMNKKKVEIREQWFIEIKLQRGEFREYKLIAEFFQYKRILHEFREMLLATLLLPRDSIVVATMYTITQELLEIIKNNMID